MPLVSFLLPTRDRLDLLKLALETVLRQDDPDWEVVVSDNHSTDDVAGYVASLGDPRITCSRTASFVPVTENWNNALRGSRGRYVLMLGDDDGLLPGYVSALRAIEQQFSRPDVVYTGACLIAYPGVMPDYPGGYVQPYSYARFFRGHDAPFVLPARIARALVDDALAFRVRYGFNMQFAAISRDHIDRLADRGPFFQSAFPDYYAMNAAFLTARQIVVDPAERVAIGVTPSSYGFFHANRREDEGRAFLGEAPDEQTVAFLEREMLPGTNINAGWLSALASLRARYGADHRLEIDLGRFRRLQTAHGYESYVSGDVGLAQLGVLRERLSPLQRAACDNAARTLRALARITPAVARRAVRSGAHLALLRQVAYWNPPRETGYASLLDLYERRDAAGGAGAAGQVTR